MAEEPQDAQTLDSLITKMIQFSAPAKRQEPIPLTEEEIWYIVDRAGQHFQQVSKALVEIDAPVTICGDTHGQFNDLIRLFHYCGWPPKVRYLFLGDYVDRGPYSIEVMCLAFLYKLRYPNLFYVLRGNHESAPINRVYGFYDECKRRYSIRLWYHFQPVFDLLPIAALVGGRIFCMHGGLSPDLYSFDQIRNMQLPFQVPPTGGLVTDLLWSDPSPDHSGYQRSNRGISYTFGEDVVTKFCQDHNIDLVCRAHQVVPEGFDFFAQKRLITVFSAPAYCGEFDNCGGMLAVSKSLHCKIKQLKPTHKDSPTR